VADEQKTIDLYFRSGLIKQKLDASDVVDRSFSDVIAKGDCEGMKSAARFVPLRARVLGRDFAP
jgi:hypothetical protein